jgi:hypothetical protein
MGVMSKSTQNSSENEFISFLKSRKAVCVKTYLEADERTATTAEMRPKTLKLVTDPSVENTVPMTTRMTVAYTTGCWHRRYSTVSIMSVQNGLVEAMHCWRAVEMLARAMLVTARSLAVNIMMSVSTFAMSLVGQQNGVTPVTKNGTSSKSVTTHDHSEYAVGKLLELKRKAVSLRRSNRGILTTQPAG